MVLGAEFLLEQRGGVGDGLVGDAERVGDLDDLVAAAQQPQDLQLPRVIWADGLALIAAPVKVTASARCGEMNFSPAATLRTAFTNSRGSSPLDI